jgi:hypothetical protein
LNVATATSVDCPLLVTIEASAKPPDGCDELLDDELVVVLELELVVVVVVVDELADPPLTVAIGAHHEANASPQVTTTFPTLFAWL